ncbi:uncharacterized protein LOC123335084 isoform X2 [Bubalus bubalis]|uniref:uncharacterized protein LOC123335084 isoform X2 n=1 Tax=Bubalus bubalis TaxID=89462 RepID=UPI001E1B66E2|nr:uncharacterized protein LOC123335084 isoform X2 [Bubalus bubalis]
MENESQPLRRRLGTASQRTELTTSQPAQTLQRSPTISGQNLHSNSGLHTPDTQLVSGWRSPPRAHLSSAGLHVLRTAGCRVVMAHEDTLLLRMYTTQGFSHTAAVTKWGSKCAVLRSSTPGQSDAVCYHQVEHKVHKLKSMSSKSRLKTFSLQCPSNFFVSILLGI